MKLLALAAATALAAFPGGPAHLSAAETGAPGWSFRFSLEGNRSPLQQELLARLKPMLGALPPHGRVLEEAAWVKAQGLFNGQGGDEIGLIVHLHFKQTDAARDLLRGAVEKQPGTWETINGVPVMKLDAPYDLNGSSVSYLAFPAAWHVVVCSSRAALDTFLQSAPGEYLQAPVEGEFLNVEMDNPVLKAAGGHSEFLSMLTGPMGLRLLFTGTGVEVQASTQLPDERTARRARRMVEGLVAMLASQMPPEAAGPLDERLQLSGEARTLQAKVALTADEVKRWASAVQADLQTEVRNTIRLRSRK